MSFKVFYDDGSTYEGDPYGAPGLGVLCILDTHNERHIDERCDYYLWMFKENGWTGVDIFGLFDYLIQPGPKKVLFGRTVSNDVYDNVKKKALAELYND